VVDEAVLRCVVLALQRPEQRLLGAENLDGGRRVLGEVHERARVRDQARAHQLPNLHVGFRV